jgi:hypothetical protein
MKSTSQDRSGSDSYTEMYYLINKYLGNAQEGRRGWEAFELVPLESNLSPTPVIVIIY